MSKRIYDTKNYNMFQTHPFNRDVKKTKDLEKSMLRLGFLPEKHINCVRTEDGKLRIKEGHHRLYVAKKLGLPVHYTISKSDISIYDLERTRRNWSLDDYLIANVREGRDEYVTIMDFQERTGIPLASCISMFSGEEAGSHNKGPAFKGGRYSISDPTHAETVGDIVLYLKNKCKISWAADSRLVQAISKMVKCKEFDVDRFKKKARTHKYLIEKKPNMGAYLEMMETIYNRQAQEKIPIAFIAREAAAKRARVWEQ